MASDPTTNPPPPDTNDHAEVRLAKLKQIEALGVDPWGQRFDGHQPIAGIRELPCEPFDDANPGPKVRAAGRVVGRRKMGKVYFLDLADQTGKVQVMLGSKQIGDLGWKVAELLDLGDLVGIDGEFGKTKMGEPTIRGKELTFLTKSLEPHPTGYYGMSDEEYRLRHRYLDLIYTPDTLRRAHQRVKLLRTLRNYLDDKGYLEVETPTLHAIAGGAAARPFPTHHNALDIPLYLRIALELPLKRLLVGGIEKVYEIGRVFRNEGISRRHNPEFTMLELYHAYGDLFTMMDLTEGIFVACVNAIGNSRTLSYGERQIDFSQPWPRVKYADVFKQTTGVDLFDRDGVKAKAVSLKIPLELKSQESAAFSASETAPQVATTAPKEHDVLVHELFEHCVEPELAKSDKPTFVYDYPAALCPLTKRKRDTPELAERFELYVAGMELANAYTELNDPITQEATFRRQLTGLSAEDSMAKMDEDFVRALRHGMPPAGGLGIGIDRLVMLLTNTTTIRDVILFPLLRQE
ncbi:lysine--tRNA ligase [Limnoglobus roseus]|uniref:Lysine--tRNA ligase n=1 Tax=Limnoglobus roseus TaxID=2598579 RepID=A0A5C1ABA3_9BACT|nr:lysine--tRNA ligase [Limnoglobus roseus]QEL16521.1 lysine--tRNA ligase [Limnoglobus roseus]